MLIEQLLLHVFYKKGKKYCNMFDCPLQNLSVRNTLPVTNTQRIQCPDSLCCYSQASLLSKLLNAIANA